MDRISGFLEGIEKVVSVYGVRRSGKSFLLRQVAKRFSEKLGRNMVLYVDFEEARFGSNDAGILVEIYDAYKEFIRPSGKPLIILDEVQEIRRWERFVRSLAFHS